MMNEEPSREDDRMDMEQRIRADYFSWLCDQVEKDCGQVSVMDSVGNKEMIPKNGHTNLLYFLHNMNFYYTNMYDRNRETDGKLLRDRFINDTISVKNNLIHDALCGPCSVLEMMVALAIRADEDLLYVPRRSYREAVFWGMMENLEISEFTDDNFSYREMDFVEHAVTKALDRDYDSFGNGGFFRILNTKIDTRNLDLWYQLNYWVQENGLV